MVPVLQASNQVLSFIGSSQVRKFVHHVKMATSDEMSELDKVRAELICSICLNLLNEPKKLDCDHSFCESCLELHSQKSPQHTPPPSGPGDVPQTVTDAVLVCPCCRQETKLPDSGIAGLKTNFKLKSLVDILSTQEREKMVQALGKDHRRVDLSELQQCAEHGEKCVFFCKDCNALFCRLCMSKHREKNHNWDNFDTVLFTYKEELRGSVQPAYEAAQCAHSAMQELDKDKGAVAMNRDAVKGKIREHFSQLTARLQHREETLLKMVDRYTEVKTEKLQQHYDQLQKGHSSLLQSIKDIEMQMQEDSIKLLTGKDDIKYKMALHRNTIRRAVPKSEDVDSFIEMKWESQIPVDTLGSLVFCQKSPRTGLVSTVRNFVETKDMEHIHLDLARPSEDAFEVPEYMQLRYARPTDDVYEELAPARLNTGAVPSDGKQFSPRCPKSSHPPLPPEPTTADDCALYSEVTDDASLHQSSSGGQKLGKSHDSEEDPYDTIPAFRSFSLSSPHSRVSSPKFLTLPRDTSVPTTRPDLLQPLQVIDLKNHNVQASGIACTHIFSNIVITDTGNQCLQMLHEGRILQSVGQPDINFQKPVALAISNTNHIFVLDQGSKVIYKLRLDGQLLFSFSTKPRRGPQKPWDIAISLDDGVYISDWSKKRVYVYSGTDGKKIRSIKGCYKRGQKDEYVGFSRPAGITFDRGGRLMITDRGEKCVWCINVEGDELIRKIGEDHLHSPYGIAIMKDGKMVVTESELDCVSVFAEDGDLLHYFGGTGSGEGQFCRPHHVFVDENEKIYVADKENKRIQIFALPEETGIYQNLI